MPNIKEIALKIADKSGAVAYSPAPLRAVRGYSFTFEQLQNFAEALIAELAKGNDPVATMFVDENIRSGEIEVDFSVEAAALSMPHGSYQVFTIPPTASQIEQETAEACAEWVRSGLHDDDPYIIARGLEDGAWKEFK